MCSVSSSRVSHWWRVWWRRLPSCRAVRHYGVMDVDEEVHGDQGYEVMQTEELARLLYGELGDQLTGREAARRRRRRLSDAAKEARRMGLVPVSDRRSGTGQRLWSVERVTMALASRKGRGNWGSCCVSLGGESGLA